MSQIRIAIGIVVFSVIHFIVGGIAFLFAFASASDRFDQGGEPGMVETASQLIVKVLWSPGWQVVHNLSVPRNDLAEWMSILGTSLLWGTALFALYSIWARDKKNFSATH